MAKQTEGQKKTVERVMHAYKHDELRIRGTGPKVKSRKQAIAIALHEAGASNEESPAANRKNLARTKRKERSGQVAAGKTAGGASGSTGRGSGKAAAGAPARAKSAGGDQTRADLYARARRRNVPGRSRMTKAQLERALRR